MSNTVLESYFLIRNIKTGKYLRFTTKTKEQLQFEVEIEARGSFYSDNVFIAGHHQAVKIQILDKAEEMLSWLNEFQPACFELMRVDLNVTNIQ